MTDYFATLGQPRRPWLDEGVLKDAFHRATAERHPDVTGGSGDEAAQVNAAYAVLKNPAMRIRHLIELEGGEGGVKSGVVPHKEATLFGRIAELHRATTAYEKKNALMKALAAEERVSLCAEMEKVLGELREEEGAVLGELRELDGRWEGRDTEVVGLLAGVQSRINFLTKWQAQLREGLFRLGA